PLRLRLLHAGDHVRRLARLRHADDQRRLVDDRIAVAVLGAVVDLDRDPRRVLEQELADEPRMPRRSAGDDVHLLELRPLLGRELQVVEVDLARLLEHPPVERVEHRARLLVDLLEHVVPVAFLLGHHGVPCDLFRRAVDRRVVVVEDLHGFLIGDGVLAVLEIDDVARVGEERRDVGGDDVLVLAEADDKRRAVLGGHDRAGLAAVDHHQRVVPFELLERLLHRLGKLRTILQVLFDEMRHDLGVGLGLELVPRLLQALLEGEEVLDDAVVDHDDLAGAVAVGMGVVLVRLPVRGPARVAHAERAAQRLLAQLRLVVAELPLGAHDLYAVPVDDGDARAVVAAVLQFFQSADQHRHDVTLAYVTNDSAHVCCPLESARVKKFLALSFAVLAACGKRRDPHPPVPIIPQATSDLVVSQRGPNVVLAWSYPSLTTAGKKLESVRRVVVYRYAEELPATQPPRDVKTIMPGDVDPT